MDILESISQYYDSTLPFYRKFWYRNLESYALHYGFWEKDTKNLIEAHLNTNKFLAETAGIKASDKILDAGCGVGGSSIWIAKTLAAKVIGITISERQIQEANKLAKANGVNHLVEFNLRNFIDTGFPDNSFDVVWGIESVCHAERKADFLQEAFRILKPGGRIVVADGFLNREAKTEVEAKMINTFNEGFATPNLSQVNNFKSDLEQIGFKQIRFYDKTTDILPSAKKIYNLCKFVYPILKLFNFGRVKKPTLNIIAKNNEAGLVQYTLVKSRLLCYGVFYAEK